ncbi:dnaJ homolog subfamily C member 1 [Gouania willdenowi]|uniref:DnaJ homolog subfamily C member 1 n=1 Tax=Gouania willdenowi TaxID=441366 RepID=A0A8C5ERW9_GOUWI|nr:dnaJ homolog subfamily C member 1 [Gouania willdenowi]
MGDTGAPGASKLLLITLLVCVVPPLSAWEADLELLDLVEEIPQTFYQFLNLEQDASSAEIKKAYRRLSLILHPDKNKDENAETQFRQLVSIYEVLKDEERRRKYDDILVNGLPDWRQPVFYYRRVRKLSNTELGLLLFLILTVGHYAVIWSIYLEKRLDELLSKKKKEKRKKVTSKPTEEPRSISQEQTDRDQDRPHWHDILPLKLTIWIYLTAKNLPQTIQEVKQYYEEYQQMKQQEKENAEAEQEAATTTREKRPKVKKPKVEFPVLRESSDNQNSHSYDQSTSIEEIEDQMDDWLQDRKAMKKKTQAVDWNVDELSLLSRLMVKFPGGTPGRWEKIAHELGRAVNDVTTKAKQLKDSVSHTSGLVKLSDLKGPLPSVKSLVDDSIITQRVGRSSEGEHEEEEEAVPVVRRRNKKGSATTDDVEVKIRGRRQKDFDPAAAEEEVEVVGVERQENTEKADPAIWTQNQQKLLELALQQFPRGTAERWDRIAKVVPGKSKEECIIRYKMLAELIQKKKQAKS